MNNGMKKYFIGLCAVAFCAAAQAKPVDHAKLSINKNDIKVWTYQDQKNPVMLYKAETIFDVPMQNAASLVIDVDNAVKWVPYMHSIKVLSRDDRKGEFTLYMVLDFPFPLKDRDLIVQGKMSRDENGMITIKNKAISQGYPKNPNYVRLTHYEGDWTFKEVAPNKVKVSTYGYANPEGALPISIVNMFVQQQPYQMLQRMKKQLNIQEDYLPLPLVLR
jgi:ribosome-associated toxin RatA of RatAB toxin-antitoxin module